MSITDKKGINITSGFKLVSGQPLDARSVADDETDLQSLIDNGAVYDGMIVWVKSLSKYKSYNGTEFVEMSTGGGSSSNILIIEDETANESTQNVLMGVLTGNFIEETRNASEGEIALFTELGSSANDTPDLVKLHIPYIFSQVLGQVFKVDMLYGTAAIIASCIITKEYFNTLALAEGISLSLSNDLLFTITYMAFSETPTITYSLKELGAGGGGSSSGGTSEFLSEVYATGTPSQSGTNNVNITLDKDLVVGKKYLIQYNFVFDGTINSVETVSETTLNSIISIDSSVSMSTGSAFDSGLLFGITALNTDGMRNMLIMGAKLISNGSNFALGTNYTSIQNVKVYELSGSFGSSGGGSSNSEIIPTLDIYFAKNVTANFDPLTIQILDGYIPYIIHSVPSEPTEKLPWLNSLTAPTLTNYYYDYTKNDVYLYLTEELATALGSASLAGWKTLLEICTAMGYADSWGGIVESQEDLPNEIGSVLYGLVDYSGKRINCFANLSRATEADSVPVLGLTDDDYKRLIYEDGIILGIKHLGDTDSGPYLANKTVSGTTEVIEGVYAMNGSYVTDPNTGAYGVGYNINLYDFPNYSTLGIEQRFGGLIEQVKAKQDKLVSGTNIKTFNGESILVGGDIVTAGKSGTGVCSEVFNDLSNNKASGGFSHAEGLRTIASGQYQHVQGKDNIEDTEDKYAHIVGNGESDSNRSNAHTLDWDGNAWFRGGIRVGGTSWDDATPIGESFEPLSYKLYADNPNITLPLDEMTALIDDKNSFIRYVINTLGNDADGNPIEEYVDCKQVSNHDYSNSMYAAIGDTAHYIGLLSKNEMVVIEADRTWNDPDTDDIPDDGNTCILSAKVINFNNLGGGSSSSSGSTAQVFEIALDPTVNTITQESGVYTMAVNETQQAILNEIGEYVANNVNNIKSAEIMLMAGAENADVFGDGTLGNMSVLMKDSVRIFCMAGTPVGGSFVNSGSTIELEMKQWSGTAIRDILILSNDSTDNMKVLAEMSTYLEQLVSMPNPKIKVIFDLL